MIHKWLNENEKVILEDNGVKDDKSFFGPGLFSSGWLVLTDSRIVYLKIGMLADESDKSNIIDEVNLSRIKKHKKKGYYAKRTIFVQHPDDYPKDRLLINGKGGYIFPQSMSDRIDKWASEINRLADEIQTRDGYQKKKGLFDELSDGFSGFFSIGKK